MESLQLDVVRFILGRDGRGGDDGSVGDDPNEREKREAEGIKLLDASQRTKLEVSGREYRVLVVCAGCKVLVECHHSLRRALSLHCRLDFF